MLEGGRDGVTTFCLRPGMEGVTSVDDVPGETTSMRHPHIAAQCCERDTGACRRFVGTNDDDGCIAGYSSNIAPFIRPMTYGENVAKCESLGLTLCSQSCRHQGCYYNRHPVFTKLPCAAPPPPPLPDGTTGSPPLPTPPPPAAPPIPSAPWVPSAAPLLSKLSSEDDETFVQRCKHACFKTESCVGFEDNIQCTIGGRCCRLHTASSTGFFKPTAAMYIKRGTTASSRMASGSLAEGASIAVVSPWDDSYGGATQASQNESGSPPVEVKVQVDLLADWRVLVGTICVFCAGLLGGIGLGRWIAAFRVAKNEKTFSKGVAAAGPAPIQSEVYDKNTTFAANL